MVLLSCTRQLLSNAIYKNSRYINLKFSKRNLMSKQLVYCEFGDPLEVVKFRECLVPPLGKTDVLVRMLAAPVNPADINTIQGTTVDLSMLALFGILQIHLEIRVNLTT